MIIGNDSLKIDAASLAAPLVNDGLSAKSGGGWSLHVVKVVVDSFKTTTATSGGETTTARRRWPSPTPPSLALHRHGGNSLPTSPSHMAAAQRKLASADCRWLEAVFARVARSFWRETGGEFKP
jgi:hypothetical protein